MNRLFNNPLKAVTLTDDEVRLSFVNGSAITLSDKPTCCANRYFRTDDTLSDFQGARFRGLSVRSVQTLKDTLNEIHEVSFLVVSTDCGDLTVCAHNEHTGSYTGFDLSVTVSDVTGATSTVKWDYSNPFDLCKYSVR